MGDYKQATVLNVAKIKTKETKEIFYTFYQNINKPRFLYGSPLYQDINSPNM